MQRLSCALLALSAQLACGGGDKACDVAKQTGCDDGQVCEVVTGADEPACFTPVVVRGQVFDLATSAGIEGARVVGLDINQAPVTSVAVTDSGGNYDLVVPSVRDENGVPASIDMTLRGDASGYQTFPSGLRQALPMSTSGATLEGDTYVVESALTDIGLIALDSTAGTGTIRGSVELDADRPGVLVVAEGDSGYSAIADRDGDFAIFNVAPGSYAVTGYSQGHSYESVDASVAGASVVDVEIPLSSAGTSTVNGQVSIVNPGDGTATSVILVVASTFDETLVRGATPPGLRSPAAGLAPDVTGAFAIEGVPAGTYKVLAGFENDELVRDPDTCIAGTAIVEQTVTAGEDVTIADTFKITGALKILSPGAETAEAVTGTPTLSWVDDSSEDQYDVTVVDALGNEVWTTTLPGSSGTDPSVSYGGPALEPGMFYQLRVVSSKQQGMSTRCEISQSEDLRGVFFVPSP